MTNQYDLPEEYRQRSRQALSGGRIELPFNAPVFWWANGDAKMGQQVGSGVLHYGGWASMKDEMESKAPPSIPQQFVRETFTARNGNPFDVYTVRILSVALVGRRFRWMQSDYGGNRSHVQYLAFAGLFAKGKGYQPWSPVVLSAKGIVTMRLEAAFSDFERATAKARNEFAGGLPSSFFYCPIGTFGEREAEMVGKQGQQSAITPPKAVIPDKEIDGDKLASWYVGKEIAGLMMGFLDQAGDWLAAWDQEAGQQKAGQPAPPEAFPEDIEEAEGQPHYDEVPF